MMNTSKHTLTQEQLNQIVQQLSNIMQRRVPANMWDYFQGTKLDISETELLVCNLNQEERTYIKTQFPDYFCQFLDFVFQLKLPNADYIPPQHHNTPIKTLLKWYTDKKSKKVTIARQEIESRYNYLDVREQLAIRIAFLQSGCKSDYTKGLHYCLHLWDGKELELVKSIWRQAPSSYIWYNSSRILIRHAPKEFLLKNKDQFIMFHDNINADLYYYFSLRFGDDPEYIIRKEWLEVDKYYALLYYTHRNFDEREWEEDLFRMVAELYFNALYRLGINNTGVGNYNRKYTKKLEYYPAYITILPNQRTLWNNAHNRWLSMLEITSISRMLRYAAYRECPLVKDFITYVHHVDYAIEKQTENYLLDPTPMVSCCPLQYQYLFSDYEGISTEVLENIQNGQNFVEYLQQVAQASAIKSPQKILSEIFNEAKTRWDNERSLNCKSSCEEFSQNDQADNLFRIENVEIPDVPF